MKQSTGLISALPFLILILPQPSATGPPGPDPLTAPTGSASPHFRLTSSVISAAGAPTSSQNFFGNGSLGQSTPTGIAMDTGLALEAGFWYGWRRLMDPSEVPPVPALINRLLPNHPNPFNPRTTISFVVAEENLVALEVYNLRGLRLRTLVRDRRSAGLYEASWDGTDAAGQPLPSGVYFFRLQIGDFRATNKMMLLK